MDPLFFHVREDRLAEAEHGEDIYAIRFLELIIVNVLEYFVGPLEGGIVYKDVDGAERIDGFPGHSLGYGNARQCRRGGGRLCDRLW